MTSRPSTRSLARRSIKMSPRQLGRVGQPPEDALERVSPPALAAAGAAVSRRADGRVFLRLRLGHAVAVRSAVAVRQLDGEKWPAPEREFRTFLSSSGGSQVDCQTVAADYGGSPIPVVFPASCQVAFSSRKSPLSRLNTRARLLWFCSGFAGRGRLPFSFSRL